MPLTQVIKEASRSEATNGKYETANTPTVTEAVVDLPGADAIPATPLVAINAATGEFLEAPEKPIPPTYKQVVTNDVTTEALAVIMSKNQRGIIRTVDELTAFIRSMNMYHGGKGADRQFYLSCWSGSAAQVDRKSQDTPILVREPFVNVVGGIQPDMLSTLENEKGEDGFIHRFLFTFPKPPAHRVWGDSQGVSRQIRQIWERVINWLFDLALEEPDDDEPGKQPKPRVLRFTAEAMELWTTWHKNHWDETEWDCFPSHLRGVWSKFEVHAQTLVLIAHLLKVACDHALTDKEYLQIDPLIDADTMRRGLLLANYFKDHNVRVFNRLSISQADLKAERVITWIRKRKDKRTTARELQMNGVVGIKTCSEAKDMLKNLQDRGFGQLIALQGGKSKAGEYFQA